MGSLLHKTKVIPNTLNPKWNSSMQFPIKSVEDDVLCFTVFDQDRFSPNGRLSTLTETICAYNSWLLPEGLFYQTEEGFCYGNGNDNSTDTISCTLHGDNTGINA